MPQTAIDTDTLQPGDILLTPEEEILCKRWSLACQQVDDLLSKHGFCDSHADIRQMVGWLSGFQDAVLLRDQYELYCDIGFLINLWIYRNYY